MDGVGVEGARGWGGKRGPLGAFCSGGVVIYLN